jgi:signal transduction histidine kinase
LSLFHRRSIGLIGQIFAIVLLTVVIEFAVSTLLYERASRLSVREDEAHRLAEHLVIVNKVLAAGEIADRPDLADQLTTERYTIRWRAERGQPPPAAPALPQMRSQVTVWEPALAQRQLRLWLKSPGRNNVVFGQMRLGDGSWVEFIAPRLLEESTFFANRILLALVPALAVILLGGLLVRHILNPLRSLATAADAIGHGRPTTLAEQGPSEVRRVIHAFNGMQARITGLIDDRTQALAAVGHDLRTPIARMRLRADGIDQDALREAMTRDLEEVDAMLSSLSAFFGGDSDPENPVPIDIAVTLATIVDDASDHGRAARYIGPDHYDVRVRPSGMKRAIGNLVNNALQYGQSVTVTLRSTADEVVIAVEDDGPGIPQAAMESVLKPFQRLDPARSRNTIGLGLGLAIADAAVQREDGTLRMSNRPQGGLKVEIKLPKSA